MPAVINGTDGITFPTWTTGTRPASPAVGQVGYNTTIGAMETYNGTTWSTSDLPATGASGNFLQSNGTAWTSASTLGVSNGGTGATTLTAGSVVVGNGTSAVNLVAAGTAGNVLTSNGTTWTSAAAGGGQLRTVVYSAPGSFSVPATVTTARITVIGGGSGGGGKNGPGAPAGGGQGGGVASVFATGLSGTYPITVGAGGSGGNGNGPQGGAQGGLAGGTSSFGAIASATGGNAGGAGTVSSGTALASGSGWGSDAPTVKSSIAGILGSVGVGAPAVANGQAAKSWTVSSGFMAGASGQTASNGSDFNGVGGYSGAVIIEYVG